MKKPIWKDGSVISLRLRDGSFALLQFLKSPYVAFFQCFSANDEWPADAAEKAQPLFVCAVAKVFLKFSPLVRKANVRPHVFTHLPEHWIRPFPGSRKVTVYPGTERAREVMLISGRAGGQLVEKRLDASGPQSYPVIRESIPLDDARTIDGYEMDGVWPYPGLNERILICRDLGRSVDPEKDLVFDRPMRPEYSTYLDIRTKHGTPEDWGYSSQPS